MINEDFEEFKQGVDSMKEPDGSINLHKYPQFLEYMKSLFLPPKIKYGNYSEIIKDIGSTVNFDLSKRYKSTDDS